MELKRSTSGTEGVDPEERAGKTLRQLRLARGWSQEEVAVRMTAYGHDFHQTAIAKIETARRPIRVRELVDFAALYGVAVQDLVYGAARSIAEVDQEINDVSGRLKRAQAAAATAATDLEEARQATRAAEASYRTAAAEVATLEGRLTALRTDRQRLPRRESVPGLSNARNSSDAQPNVTIAESSPTVVRLALGAHLRRLREANGIAREDAAYAIRTSSAKLARIELGRTGIKERDVADLLDLYGMTGKSERRQLLELVCRSSVPSWRETYSDILPSWFSTYIGLEMAADEVRMYEARYVPDLLQTEEYARAVTTWDLECLSSDNIEQVIEFRAVRNKTFWEAEAPPRLQIVLDEAALRREVGGSAVMRGQLMHIIDMAELPNVVIQVVPLANSSHSADGSFRILRFSEADLSDIVYIEQLANSIFLDNATQTALYQQAINQLTSQALTPGQTTSFVRQLLAA